MNPHLPNPYDFVPFSTNEPNLKTVEKFSDFGKNDEEKPTLFSGYLEVQIKALTPIHMVGDNGDFYREDGRPVLSGSGIRGMLRTFIEAVTNGWVSQTSPKYEKKHRKRTEEFFPFEEDGSGSPFSIPPQFRPRWDDTEKTIDLATYLFGYVFEEKRNDAEHQIPSKVWVEDAPVNLIDLENAHTIPDVEGDAFFGNPLPRRSNWWYFTPGDVVNNGNKAKFSGNMFRGRKFYYHQQPEGVTAIYRYRDKWLHDQSTTIEEKHIESMKKDATATFRLYVDRLPESLLRFLCVCVSLPGDMRHKLGYGRPFGYGSIEMSITDAQLRIEKEPDWPDDLGLKLYPVNRWVDDGWIGLDEFVDESSLAALQRIMRFDASSELRFVYPPYEERTHGNSDPRTFKLLLDFGVVKKAADEVGIKTNTERFNVGAKGKELAEQLWSKKRTIDFELYQEKAEWGGDSRNPIV